MQGNGGGTTDISFNSGFRFVAADFENCPVTPDTICIAPGASSPFANYAGWTVTHFNITDVDVAGNAVGLQLLSDAGSANNTLDAGIGATASAFTTYYTDNSGSFGGDPGITITATVVGSDPSDPTSAPVYTDAFNTFTISVDETFDKKKSNSLNLRFQTPQHAIYLFYRLTLTFKIPLK